MANFYTDMYNNLIDNSEEIYNFLTGAYMNQFKIRQLIVISIMLKL